MARAHSSYYEPEAGKALKRLEKGICTIMFEVLMDKQEVTVYICLSSMKRSDFEHSGGF